MIAPRGDLLVSTLRVSTLDDLMFMHSAYPTDASDTVFFGPDSYRFAAFLNAEMPTAGAAPTYRSMSARDLGVGAVDRRAGSRTTRRLTVTDINPRALALRKSESGCTRRRILM